MESKMCGEDFPSFVSCRSDRTQQQITQNHKELHHATMQSIEALLRCTTNSISNENTGTEIQERKKTKKKKHRTHAPFPGQPFQKLGSILVAIRVAVTGHTVFLVSPGINCTRGRDDCRVPRPASDVADGQAHQNVDAFGSGMSDLVSVTELSVHSTAPVVRSIQ
mmetsp:Transcript_18644/g.38228  ORF Transcript_18644/g.38228 Transcript_18644/m.38228 type:complete len:165 (-) Transcript_18644:37-531(-)